MYRKKSPKKVTKSQKAGEPLGCMVVTAPTQDRLLSIYERQSSVVNSDAGGLIAGTVPISAAGLISAGRLAGYQALRDQIKIIRVTVTLAPFSGTGSTGRTVVYVERDPTAAVVGSVYLASDQFESRSAMAWEQNALTWRPQQPTDYLYNLLNPGTVVLANMYLKGSGYAATTACYTQIIEVWAVLRGRP